MCAQRTAARHRGDVVLLKRPTSMAGAAQLPGTSLCRVPDTRMFAVVPMYAQLTSQKDLLLPAARVSACLSWDEQGEAAARIADAPCSTQQAASWHCMGSRSDASDMHVWHMLTAPDAAGNRVQMVQRIHVWLAHTVVLFQRCCQVSVLVFQRHLR